MDVLVLILIVYTFMSRPFHVCFDTISALLSVITSYVYRLFRVPIRQCANCGIDLPRDSTDSMCTVCSVGYRDDLILPDQEVAVDGDELIDVCQHTLSKLSID